MINFQEDDDGHYTALQVIQQLMRKAEDVFIDQFARLGVFGKVLSLAGPPEEDDEEEEMARADERVRFRVIRQFKRS